MPVPAAGTATPPAWWAWIAAVLGGLAGALAFDPVAWRPLIVLAPLGCFLAVRWSATPRQAFLRALAFGWVYYFGTLHWLLTIRAYAPAAFIGVLGVVLLGVYLGLYPALAALVLRRWLWPRGGAMQFALFAALWLIFEWLRTLGKLGMSLAQLGHAWATIPWAIQIAQWLGELGVSLQVLYLAGLIFFAGRWSVGRFGPKRHGIPLANRAGSWLIGAMVLLAGIWTLFSARTFHQWNEKSNASLSGGGTLNVALEQPNIPEQYILTSCYPLSKDDPPEWAKRVQEFRNFIEERREGLLASLTPGHYDLVLLPETSFTEQDFFTNTPLRNHVYDIARRLGADMLVPAGREVSVKPKTEYYNTVFFVHKDGTFDPNYYDKMRLVPFGENLPYFDMIPGFQDTFVGNISMMEGKRPVLFTTHGRRFGTLICFESTFSASARTLVNMGADFLTVVTNDAWYEMSAGAPNHHDLSLLRAVETRRWLLRCANTGISSVIAPSGTIQSTLGLGNQGIVEGKIAPGAYAGRTLFTRIGNAWLVLAFLLIGLSIPARIRNRSI